MSRPNSIQFNSILLKKDSYQNKCNNCTNIHNNLTTLHILPHPHAHTPAQTQNTQGPPHTLTHPVCKLMEFNSNWVNHQCTSAGRTVVHRGKAAYTGHQGTSVCMSMRHAQGHPLKNNIERIKQTAVLEKGLGFCSKAKQSKAQGCFWSDWFSCGTGTDLMNFSNFYHETETLKG